MPIWDDGLYKENEEENDNVFDYDSEVTDDDFYSNVSSKEALECFYKLKGFFNQNNPDGLNEST